MSCDADQCRMNSLRRVLPVRRAMTGVVLGIWDKLWTQKVESLNISIDLFLRYMDDRRALLYQVQPGWRLEEAEIVYCSKWVVEDRKLTPTQRTLNIIK